jgi:hypothetical protein
LAYSRLDVAGVIGRDKMKASRFARELVEEGRIEGQLAGQLSTKRADILRVLRLRFGDRAGDHTAALAALDSLQRLEQLFDLAASCPSPDDFRAALPAEGSPA